MTAAGAATRSNINSNSGLVLFGLLHSTQQATTTMVESQSDRLLRLSLELVGFKTSRIERTRYKKNLSRFRRAFGVGPETVAQILNDLSQHEVEEEPDAVWLLIALNWIRVYNTEEFMEGVFEDQNRASKDLAAFLHDKQIPRPQAAAAAYPCWQDSEAEQLLKSDIEAGIGTSIKPEQLWNSRVEYQSFPLTVFRKHIYQELRAEAEKGYWLNKKKEKEDKKKKKKQQQK